MLAHSLLQQGDMRTLQVPFNAAFGLDATQLTGMGPHDLGGPSGLWPDTGGGGGAGPSHSGGGPPAPASPPGAPAPAATACEPRAH